MVVRCFRLRKIAGVIAKLFTMKNVMDESEMALNIEPTMVQMRLNYDSVGSMLERGALILA
jgi:hypothetical protein